MKFFISGTESSRLIELVNNLSKEFTGNEFLHYPFFTISDEGLLLQSNSDAIYEDEPVICIDVIQDIRYLVDYYVREKHIPVEEVTLKDLEAKTHIRMTDLSKEIDSTLFVANIGEADSIRLFVHEVLSDSRTMEVFIKERYKSIMPNKSQSFHLPKFTVLTGKNGSGKTHLLEALADRDFSVIKDPRRTYTNIKYLKYNSLNPTVNTDCSLLDLSQNITNNWSNVQQILYRYQTYKTKYKSESVVRDKMNHNDYLILKQLRKRAHYHLERVDEKFFYKNFDFSWTNSDDLFNSDFASIFRLYFKRWDDNRYNKYINDIEGKSLEVLSDSEFESLYGPKPWELINQMMDNAGLPYSVNSPEDRDGNFHLCLLNNDSGIKIDVSDLSTGERVLMSLALAIYNSSDKGEKPDLLLIDEPDAPLHPEFSKVLIDSIKKSIVDMAGVNVIITTHTPSTVAVCDESSLFKMDKDSTRPVKVTKQYAIDDLIKGIGDFHISIDNRRPIFVENKNDIKYYEKIFRLIDQPLDISPCFLTPSTQTPNCTDVINITQALTGMGNKFIYGLIDYDNHNITDGNVIVVGDGTRYAIENYIFDPIFIALLLIRERIVDDTTPNFPYHKFTEIRQCSDTVLQKMIDYVCDGLSLSGEKVEYLTQSGMCFHTYKALFNMQGHKLEEEVLKRWPGLNKVKGGHSEESVFKVYLLDNVIYNYPEFIPMDIVNTFLKIK